jgi:hypothetical protein
MNIDELRASAADAQGKQAALERALTEAAPEQRAALEQQLRLATEDAHRAAHQVQQRENELHAHIKQPVEVAGFGSADLTKEEARGDTAPAPVEPRKEPEAVRDLETVQTFEVVQGARLGALTRETKIVEVHTHPDIVEARQANAREAAVRAQLAQEAEQKKAQEKARAEAERKDMDAAARLYEGLPQNRGITREQYVKMETDWQRTLDANPEKRAALAEHEKAEYLDKRNSTSEVPYREAEPGEAIEGKIVGVRSFEGVKHTIIEKSAPPPERVVVEGEVKGAAIGKQVEIRTDEQRRLQEVRDRAARDRTHTPER